MSIPPKWKTRLCLMPFIAMLAAGADLVILSPQVTMATWLLRTVAILLFLGGGFGFTMVVAIGKRSGALYKYRREILLTVFSSIFWILLALGVSVALRVAPKYPLAGEIWDPEIGAMPSDRDLVGSRKDKIDTSKQHILLIGDSILYGWKLADDEVIGRRLQPLVEPYQVLNLSKPGWSIDQYWLYLRSQLPRTRSRLVIVGIFSGNDFENTAKNYGWGHTKPFYRMDGDRLVRINPDVLAPNCIDQLAQSLLFRPLWNSRELAYDLVEFFCSPPHLNPAEEDRVIDRLLDEIDKDSAAHGAKVLYVLLPTKRWLEEWATSDCQRYETRYDRLRSILEAGHRQYYEPLVDLLRTDRSERYFLEDNAHFNAEGHRLLAEFLAREIRDRNLLP